MDWFEKIKQNSDYFEQVRKKTIVCYGAGAKGRQSIQILKEHGIDPVAVCDANPELWGKTCEGVPILSYDEMQTKFNNYTILLTCVLENAISIRNYLLSRHESNLIVFFQILIKLKQKYYLLMNLLKRKVCLMRATAF